MYIYAISELTNALSSDVSISNRACLQPGFSVSSYKSHGGCHLFYSPQELRRVRRNPLADIIFNMCSPTSIFWATWAIVGVLGSSITTTKVTPSYWRASLSSPPFNLMDNAFFEDFYASLMISRSIQMSRLLSSTPAWRFLHRTLRCFESSLA